VLVAPVEHDAPAPGLFEELRLVGLSRRVSERKSPAGLPDRRASGTCRSSALLLARASEFMSSLSHACVNPWKNEVENIRPGGGEKVGGPFVKPGTTP
jgi:hypothetical protein